MKDAADQPAQSGDVPTTRFIRVKQDFVRAGSDKGSDPTRASESANVLWILEPATRLERVTC